MPFLHIRSAIALIGLLSLITVSMPALADEGTDTESVEQSSQARVDSAFEIGLDLVVLRPLGLVALAGGVGLFVPAVILTAPGGSEGVTDSVDIFVVTPWRDLFDRPLGDFGS